MARNQKPENRNQKNLTKLLRQRLPRSIFEIIRKIGNLAEDNGISAYIVGGFVRDILLGVKNLDLDIVVEGQAINFSHLLKKRITRNIVIHQRFGTATLTLPNKFKIDIATSRKEYYAYAAALPRVYSSGIREDLFRRDFTINALAIKINGDDFGELLDLFGGQKDLKEKKIRVLHAQSFIDDPTRILRAIRFEQRYNFTIEGHTQRLIHQAIKQGMLKKLSKFRIGNELILILQEEKPLDYLLRLSSLCRGFRFIHPSIKLNRVTVKQLKAAKGFNWLVYFMILTARLKLAELEKLCRDFSLTKSDTRKVISFKKNSQQALRAIEDFKALSGHQIYQILHSFSYQENQAMICQAKSKRAQDKIGLFLQKLSRIKIKLRGSDLKKLKLEPGPRYRDLLEQILYAKLDGKLKSKTDELNYLKRLLK